MELVDYEYKQMLPVSFSKSFINYLNTNVNGSLCMVKSGEILLPLLVRTRMKFKMGYFIHPPVKNGSRLSLEEEKEFFKLLVPFFKKNKQLDFIVPPLHLENFHHIPDEAKGYKLSLINVQLEDKTTDQIFESFKSVYRRHIRNAEKANVMIKFGLEYFDDFYTIYSEKLKLENAVHDSYDTIKKIAFNTDEEINVQCGVAYLNGEIEAGVLNVSDASNAYYIFGGSSRNAHNGSFRLLHWELIKKYKDENLKSYKLGAYREGEMLTSKHERLASFKMGFGSEIQEGYHFTLILSPFKFWLYSIILKIKIYIP